MEYCEHHKSVIIERYCIDCCKAICYRCATSLFNGLHSMHRVEHSADGLATAKLKYVQILEQCRKLASSAAGCSSNSHNVHNCTCDSRGNRICNCSGKLTDINSLINSIIENLETTRVNMSTAVLRACQTAHGQASFRSTSTRQAPHTASTSCDNIKYTRKQYRADVEASARVDARTRRQLSSTVDLTVSQLKAVNFNNNHEIGIALHKLAAEIAVIDKKLRELQTKQMEHAAAANTQKQSENAQTTPIVDIIAVPVDVMSSAMKQNTPLKTHSSANATSKKQLQAVHIKLDSMRKLAKTLQRSSVYLYRTPELILLAGGQEIQCSGALLRLVPNQTQWTEVSLLHTPRYEHAAATLHNKIIVAGGSCSNDNVLKSVEQFDTQTSTTTTLASLQIGRRSHRLVSTGDSVYALGGVSGSKTLLSSVEQYSAEKNEWAICVGLERGRYLFAAVTCGINNGIIIAGGTTNEDEASSSCELYNPLEGSKSIASLNLPRQAPVAACLAGSVYVFGGGTPEDYGLSKWNKAEQYSVESDAWTLLIQRMVSSRHYFAASGLNDKVYLIGGVGDSTVEVFNSKNESFEPATSLPYELYNSAATAAVVGSNAEPALSNDSAIYVIGGLSRRLCQSLVAVEPIENLRFDLRPMLVPRSFAASIAIQGKFIVSGGKDSKEKRLNSAEVFDIESKKWTSLPPLKVARSGLTLAVLGDTLYAIAGFDGNQRLDSVEMLRIGKGNEWIEAPSILTKRNLAAGVTFKDVILVIGGRALVDNELSRTSSCEMYSPEIGSIAIGSLVIPRQDPLVTKYGNTVYVMGGEENFDQGVKSVEQYNAETDQWTFIEKLLNHVHIRTQCSGFNGCYYLYCCNYDVYTRSCVKIFDAGNRSFMRLTKLPFRRDNSVIGCISVSEEVVDELLNSVETPKSVSHIAGESSTRVVGKVQRSESKFSSYLRKLTTGK